MVTDGSEKSPARKQRFGLSDRLLAEAVRLLEDSRDAPFDDPAADAHAQARAEDFESRIVIRAARLSVGKPIRAALRRMRTAVGAATTLGIAVAFLAGTGTVRLMFDTTQPVNFFSVLAALLGLPTLALAAWLLLMLFRPGLPSFNLFGGFAVAAARLGLRGAPPDASALQAARATGVLFSGSGPGLWLISGISHAIWLSFLCGATLSVLFLLGTRQYDFVWETTILDADSYRVMADWLAVVPQAMGFSAPDAAQLAASQWTGGGLPDAGTRRAWAGLLTGSLFLYGLLPRGLLLVLCLGLAWRGRARYRLDTTRIGFARLRARLMPTAHAGRVVDADPSNGRDATPAPDLPLGGTGAVGTGEVAVFALEIEPPASAWPPPVPGIDWRDLGTVDDRASRHRLFAEIAAAPPRAALAVCAMGATPDRGVQVLLSEIQAHHKVPVLLLLTGGGELDATRRDRRLEDWRSLADHAGIRAERVCEIDLDRPAADGIDCLARLLGGAA